MICQKPFLGELMNKAPRYLFIFGTWMSCILSAMAYAQQPNFSNPPNYSSPSQPNFSHPSDAQQSFKIGIVNTKKCLENSKLGKQEQANFEQMKKQMETVLQEKEKQLEEIESKLNDDDYMDSITDEVASELKRKKRTIRNEGMQLQSQYMQTLQQTNVKIIQKLTEVIAKASAQVAKEGVHGQLLDVIFTDEACTFYSPRLDISDLITEKMNVITDAEQKDKASKTR